MDRRHLKQFFVIFLYSERKLFVEWMSKQLIRGRKLFRNNLRKIGFFYQKLYGPSINLRYFLICISNTSKKFYGKMKTTTIYCRKIICKVYVIQSTIFSIMYLIFTWSWKITQYFKNQNMKSNKQLLLFHDYICHDFMGSKH